MNLGLQNKTAVVLAASKGLGKACAQLLAAEGANLALCARDPETLNNTASQIRQSTGRTVLAHPVDLSNPIQINDFAQKVEAQFSQIDILINNTGGPPPGVFDALSAEDFQRATDLLLLSVIRATKAFLPLLRKSQSTARIITLTGLSTREVLPNLMLSNTLRSAVLAWSKTLARELGPENITVNCVAPGTIQTDRIDKLITATAQKTHQSESQTRETMRSKIPLQRFGAPEELANAVAFLASAQASYVSGTTIYVDGAASTIYL